MTNQKEPSNPKNFTILWLMLTAVLSATLVLLVLFSGLLPLHLEMDTQKLAVDQTKNTVAVAKITNTSPDSAAPKPPANPVSTPDLVSPIPSDILLPEQQNTVTLIVPPNKQLTYSIAMERDYALNYIWHTDGKPLYCEFRGERTDGKDKVFRLFKKINSDKASGLFIVPFIGNFSWYWDNKTSKPVTVLLSMKGAYKILGVEG
jgi:hypothetical protein